jgi:oligopeptide transport system substrate-binding protein
MGDKFPRSISIKINSGVEGHKVIAENVKQQLSTNLDGIDVELSSMEWKTFLKETNAGNFEVARLGWIGSTPDPESQFLIIFKCGSPYNRSRWCNQEFMRLFTLAEQKVDRTERFALLQEAEKIMLEESAVIPLYVYTQKHLRKPYVRNFAVNSGDNPPRHRVWIDPNWRERPAARQTRSGE